MLLLTMVMGLYNAFFEHEPLSDQVWISLRKIRKEIIWDMFVSPEILIRKKRKTEILSH